MTAHPENIEIEQIAWDEPGEIAVKAQCPKCGAMAMEYATDDKTIGELARAAVSHLARSWDCPPVLIDLSSF